MLYDWKELVKMSRATFLGVSSNYLQALESSFESLITLESRTGVSASGSYKKIMTNSIWK